MKYEIRCQPLSLDRLKSIDETELELLLLGVARLCGYVLNMGESHHHKHRYNKAMLYRLAARHLDIAAEEIKQALELLHHGKS